MVQDEARKPMVSPAAETAAVRQGVTLGVMRYVLGISLVLVIVALGAAWFGLFG